MGASVAATVQHLIEDSGAVKNAAASTFTAGGSDLYRQKKDAEAAVEEEKKRAAQQMAEVKQQETQAAAQDTASKRRAEGISAQRAKRARSSGRAGTILTSPLGAVEDNTQKRTVLGG